MYIVISQDVVEFNGEAIVNSLGPGPKRIKQYGKIYRSILKKAGAQLEKDIIEKGQFLSIGDTFITDAYGLPSKKVVNIITPFRRDDDDNLSLLIKAYRSILDTAYDAGIRSICVPMIGSGANRYDSEDTCKIAKMVCYAYSQKRPDLDIFVDVYHVEQSEGSETDEDEGAVYLSGNGPLVAVLNEALAKDCVARCLANGEKKNITDARREVKKSIQMIHAYRDTMLAKIVNPVVGGELQIDTTKAVENDESGFGEVEHVAIFDEAQRSWTHKRLHDYLKRGGTYGNKLKVPNFPLSEAAFLIWSLDQRKDWATIVCLVGGGQEINTGEAGISEWIKAINEKFPHWNVYISPKLTDKEYAEGKVNELLAENSNVTYADDLHLAVSLRSFRAEKLSAFVHAMLTFDDRAKDIYDEIKGKYPIILTRDMSKARRWLRDNARGSERTGVLVSKESARFKPLAIHVLQSGDENAVHWFLEDKTDTRSSNYLEDAATEIQVQGLELDYTCLLWDADMRYENGEWKFYHFNGRTDWCRIIPDTENKEETIKYMLNAYRVLLTRGRKGMIVCVPEGNSRIGPNGFPEDKTRLPSFYDGTYQYLKSIGIKEI